VKIKRRHVTTILDPVQAQYGQTLVRRLGDEKFHRNNEL
jgi:hypothetical protein